MPRPSTSSYVVLGLLAVKPWTAYELVQYMSRSSLHFVWPKAESKLYEEPKRLVDRGWASATAATDGRRATIYEITDAGRSELRRWVAEPSRGGISCESEALIRVFAADVGSKDRLLRVLHGLLESVEADLISHHLPNAEEYASGEFLFPERAHHLSALVGSWILDNAEATVDWAVWALREVEGWPATDEPTEAMREFARECGRRWLAQHERIRSKLAEARAFGADDADQTETTTGRIIGRRR